MLVILTGASGSGKTTLARAYEKLHPETDVFFFDSIGVPSLEIMQSFGEGHQPGGAWQRAMTIRWLEEIKSQGKRSVLFEGQMRLAFIREALKIAGITLARIVLVDCDDKTRAARLTHDRRQPELADSNMMHWARYLREEAEQFGCEVLDTGTTSFPDCIRYLESRLLPR